MTPHFLHKFILHKRSGGSGLKGSSSNALFARALKVSFSSRMPLRSRIVYTFSNVSRWFILYDKRIWSRLRVRLKHFHSNTFSFSFQDSGLFLDSGCFIFGVRFFLKKNTMSSTNGKTVRIEAIQHTSCCHRILTPNCRW